MVLHVTLSPRAASEEQKQHWRDRLQRPSVIIDGRLQQTHQPSTFDPHPARVHVFHLRVSFFGDRVLAHDTFTSTMDSPSKALEQGDASREPTTAAGIGDGNALEKTGTIKSIGPFKLRGVSDSLPQYVTESLPFPDQSGHFVLTPSLGRCTRAMQAVVVCFYGSAAARCHHRPALQCHVHCRSGQSLEGRAAQ